MFFNNLYEAALVDRSGLIRFCSGFHGRNKCIRGNYIGSGIWLAGKSGVEKEAEKRTNFLHPSPVHWGEAYGGGRCPQEYEVDMLGRHIILSTYRRLSNFSYAFLSLFVLSYP